MEKITWAEKLKFDYDRGQIDIAGLRSTMISSMGFRSNREAMAEVLGHNGADVILYMVGKDQVMDYISRAMKDTKGMKTNERILAALDMLSQYGYGKPGFEMFDLEGESIIILKESCMAYYYREKKEKPSKPVCSNFSGMIAGIMEAMTGKPYKVTEIGCLALGENHCRFMAKPENIVRTSKRK